MKRSDDVFFFTLIDFLLQVFFFGLLLYVFARNLEHAKADVRQAEAQEIAKLKAASGVSNITELTDLLTNLAPLKELRGTSDFIARAGGIDNAIKAFDFVQKAGGPANLALRLDKLRALEEGTGKPPCLFTMVNDKKVPKQLAVVTATDTAIAFNAASPELDEVLRLLNRTYASVQQLTLAEFRQAFSGLAVKRPECRYTLRFREMTQYVHARDAARFAFYLNIESIK